MQAVNMLQQQPPCSNLWVYLLPPCLSLLCTKPHGQYSDLKDL